MNPNTPASVSPEPLSHATPDPDVGAQEECTEEALAAVMGTLLERIETELNETTREELEKHWFFKWNDTHSLEQNLYNFHDLLELYGSYCRRWEEKHHGYVCVVERVRDTYLMPKINAFMEQVRARILAAPPGG